MRFVAPGERRRWDYNPGLLRRENTVADRDLFGEKAEGWDSRPMAQQLSEAIGDAIAERVPLSPDLHVMDFGAGTGLIASRIAPHVAKIAAVDVSDAMLQKLAAKPELQGKVEALCHDITLEELDLRFGLIVSAMAMHHVEDTRLLLTRFANHLEPGGRIALADLDLEDGSFHAPGTEGIYHKGFERAALTRLLEDRGFTDIEFTTVHTVIREQGEYPIFLVTARKAVA